MSFQPNGKTANEPSFITKWAQDILNQSTQFEIIGSPTPTEEFSFDGWKISGFENHFPPNVRYIKPMDKNKAFAQILG